MKYLRFVSLQGASRYVGRDVTKVDIESIFEHPLSFDEDDGFQGEKYDDTEWDFVPREEYHGHDQNPALQGFILRQLEADAEGGHEAGVTDNDQDIMQSLRFVEMLDRHENISDAYSETFEMIYGDISPWSNFREWLQSGSGCYWINGKAGSGKSTLMKFIFGHSKTREALEIWASSPWTRASTERDLRERQPIESNTEVGKRPSAADTSITPSKPGRFASTATTLRSSRSRITLVEYDPSVTQHGSGDDSGDDARSEGKFSSPWVLPVWVLSRSGKPNRLPKKSTSVFTVAHFFWGSGTSLQRSESGMLRSLLYQSLDADPGLIPKVLADGLPGDLQSHPKKVADSGRIWDIHRLRQAFQRLLGVASEELRFCFFIDGLDECDGFQVEDANYLRSQNPFVKFCISSRPWVAFEDAFQDSPSLRLQDLTAPDIQGYVESTLRDNPLMLRLEKENFGQVNLLIKSIVLKAKGVFLWVVLVVRSILQGLRNRDSLMDLERRIDQLPADLENLYEQMISSINPFYKEESAKIFQVVYQMMDQNDAVFLCYALWEDKVSFGNGNKEQYEQILERLRRILQSRTAGLIELHTDEGSSLTPWKEVTMSYIHRHVKFLVERSDQFSLPEFNANAVLLKACVSTLEPGCLDASWNAMDYIHDRWETACIFAKRIDDKTAGEIQLELLREFGKRATDLASSHRHGKEKLHLHWSNKVLTIS